MGKTKTARKKPMWQPVRSPLTDSKRGRTDLEKKVIACIERIAAEKEALRDLIGEYASALESTSDAVRLLEDAVELMSEKF